MAFNAKEFNKNAESERYLRLSLKNSKSKRNKTTKVRSSLALAEIYYNNNDYKRAIPLYSYGLKKSSDRWWTKDAFNLAWCYFRTGKKTKAISLMKKIYKRSHSDKYVDMSYNVERDLVYFFTDAGRINDAISFYKINGKDVVKNLLRVGRYLKNQGKLTLAKNVFEKASRHGPSDEDSAGIYSELAFIYEKFGNEKLHLNIMKKMVALHNKNSLRADHLETLIYHVRKVGAKLQKQVASKRFARRKKAKKKKIEKCC